MNDWQTISRIDRGYKKGEVVFTVLKSRGTGKSMFGQNMMRIRFNGAWTKWEEAWTWKPIVSNESGKMLWGKVMVRRNRFLFSNNGHTLEYASPKEAFKQQKEEFKDILSRG